MQILPSGSKPTQRAPEAYFTGMVWQDPIIDAPAPARIRGVRVTFGPGARTNWHIHPLGQTLLVVSGLGRIQSDGGPLLELRPGDAVWIAPGERHWHGASPEQAMVHLAFHEALNGVHADWMEPVPDEVYTAEPQKK